MNWLFLKFIGWVILGVLISVLKMLLVFYIVNLVIDDVQKRWVKWKRRRAALTLCLLPLLSLCGCAYMHSTTSRSTPFVDPVTNRTNIVEETTKVTAYAILDSHNSMLTLRNQSGYSGVSNRYAPGTYVGGLNQESNTTNWPAIAGAVAEGVVKGLK